MCLFTTDPVWVWVWGEEGLLGSSSHSTLDSPLASLTVSLPRQRQW